MATTICDGAAKNSALSMAKRLINSHSNSPPATDRMPAKYRGRNALAGCGDDTVSARRVSGGLTVLTPSLVTLIGCSSVGNLRHARQQQAIHRKIRRNIAERAQRLDHVADFFPGHLAGRLEQILVAEKAVGLFHVVLADLAHLHLQLDRGLAVLPIVEPGDALVVAI